MADRDDHCSRALYHNHPSLSYAFGDLGWKSCWGGFKCFTPRRREKYLRAEDAHVMLGPTAVEDPIENGSVGLDILNKVAVFPPVMCAPPSSPVSFRGNMGSAASSHLSPATLLTLFPENSERFGSQPELQFDTITTGAPVGFFMLDNALVTPPLYSTLTTASPTPLSTAPFTPPPELAHLTTPSSPEVPSAQLLGPSSEFKSSLSEKVHEHLSLQSFPPNNLELTYKRYPCSPIGQIVIAKSGASSPETLSPLPERVCLEEGTTTTVNNFSVSAFGNASFEGFGMATSESVYDKRIMEQVLQEKAVSLQRVQRMKGQSTNGADLLEQYNMPIVLDSYWHELQDSIKCCSRCGELSAKCKDLSEALEQTQKKLTLVERRVDSIDERERKFKQLMQWMQLGAKLQQESFFELSKELSWQEAAFSDLQDCGLAEAGINIPNTGKDDT